MKYKTLFSVGFSERDPFGIFDQVKIVHKPEELNTDGMLILWGGEDISPSIYNQRVIHARAPEKPSRRDQLEINMFNAAVKLGIPIIGVCRGAQLACALSGGTLYQHIQGGHHGDHEVETYDGKTMHTSSCHHQALNLSKINHELLAWDKDRTIVAFTDKEVEKVVIPEVALLTETKTLAIQGHPEWMHHKDDFVKWCSNILTTRFA
jgi:gamma-glutamyl-gamma-aminobutyrate hydrolase PuuD